MERYIELWTTNKLIIDRAEKDVEIDFETFNAKANKLKEDLIIHEYNNHYLRQNLDTTFTDKELEDYYLEHKSNFVLKEKIIKGFFIKMRLTSPLLKEFKRTFKKNDSTSLVELKKMSQSQATNYLFVENTWTDLGSIISNLPQPVGSKDLSSLLKRKELTIQSDDDIYFVRVFDIRVEEEIAPMEMKLQTIKNIILNERKLSLIHTLKDTIYTNSKKRD